MGKIYVGQEATLRADTKQSVAAASSLELRIRKPGGSVVIKPATAVPGQPTKIEWTAAATDFDIKGIYKVQALVAFSGGKQPGETYSLVVYGAFG